MKKLIALLTLVATIGLTANVGAAEISYDYQGYGYTEVRETPSLVPIIAVGALAIVAIVVVAVQSNGHGGSGQGHGHSH